MKEEKREKFIAIAEKRVSSAIKTIKLIGNLANKKNYEYTDNHAREIITALENELKDLKKKFSSGENGKGGAFKFKS